MGELVLAAQVISTVVSTVGAIKEGRAANSAAKAQASQLQARANQERAVAQLRAQEERRAAGLATSRAKALIAAGGGDTSDVGSQDIISGIEAEGEYRSLAQLYEGEEAAKGSEFQAATAIKQGKAAKQAGMFKAITNLVSGGSSIYDKYAPSSSREISGAEEDRLIKNRWGY